MTTHRTILGMLSLVGVLCGFCLLGFSFFAIGLGDTNPMADADGKVNLTFFNCIPLPVFWLLQVIIYAIYALVAHLTPSPFWGQIRPMGCYLTSISLTVVCVICGTTLWYGGTLPCVAWLLNAFFHLAICFTMAFGCVDRLIGNDDDDDDHTNEIYSGTDDYINANDLTGPLMAQII